MQHAAKQLPNWPSAMSGLTEHVLAGTSCSNQEKRGMGLQLFSRVWRCFFFALSTVAPLLKGPSLTLKDIVWKECVFSVCKLRRITMVVMERGLIRKSKVQTGGHAGTRELCVKLRSEGVSSFCNHETALCQAKWSRCSQESGSMHAIAAIFAQESCISCTAGR